MTGLIATSCRNEVARYVDFYRMRDELITPGGWKKELFPGFFPDYNINNAVKRAFQENLDYVFIIDDDQILPPDSLMKLLAHDKDIVVCNLISRSAPFNPYIFKDVLENGEAYPDVFEDRKGLIEVGACGTGGILIKTSVFRSLEFPWFTHNEFLKTYDLYFCHEARKAGYKIYCDLDTPSGHMVPCVVWPTRREGKWKTSIVINNSFELIVPTAVRVEGSDNEITIGKV